MSAMALFPTSGSLADISCSNFQAIFKEILEKAERTSRKTQVFSTLYCQQE